MKKEIEYVIRYDDGNKIATMYCTDVYNMTDLLETLEKHNITYMVVKVKNKTDHEINWLCDVSDLFGGK